MAKLQSFKRIIIEDYDSKYKDLISKLAYSLNGFADDVLNAFNKSLTTTDNLSINQKTINISVNVSGNPVSKTTVTSGLSSICTGMSVIKVTNTSNSSSFPTTTPFISFQDNNGQITINNISGLKPNNNYQLQVILWN